MIIVSDKAKERILELRKEEGRTENENIRVSVKGGGCSGLSYVLDFDTKEDNDELFDIDGIPCIMDKGQGMYLYGMQIDWDNGLSNRGFTFSNPNASKTCGCCLCW